MYESGFGRVIGVLVAPVKTFQSIVRRPTWVAPLVLLVVLGTALGLFVVQRMDFAESTRQRLEKQGTKLTDEQMEKSLALVKKFAPYGAVGYGLVVAPALYLLLAAIFWVALRMVGSELEYKTSLSILLYSFVPWVLASILAIPVVLARSKISSIDMQRNGGVLLSNAAAWAAPEGAGPALLAFLSSLDVFTVWTVILLVLGYRETSPSHKTAATVTVVALCLLYVAGKVGLASLSLFG